MNIKSLLLAPVCALLAVSAASASNVLFSEDWSDFSVGSGIFDAGSGWKYYGNPGMGNRLVIADVGTEEAPKKVLSSVFQSGDNFLPYAAVSQSFTFGQGVSLDVTFERRAPTTNYVRLAFMASNQVAPTGSNIYVVDFGATSFKVARGSTNLSASIAYTSVGAVAPVNNYGTFSFQIAEHDDGVLLKVLYGDTVIWSDVDASADKLDFSSGVTAMIGPRSGVNYISNVEVTALIPEASHFGIAAGIAALLAVGLLRRRSRRTA